MLVPNNPLEEILDAIKATLDHCSPELAADLVDNGLVLCGGGALLRRIDRYITEQTGLPTRITPEPLTAVAQGLLICMEHFQNMAPLAAIERGACVRQWGSAMAHETRTLRRSAPTGDGISRSAAGLGQSCGRSSSFYFSARERPA